MRRGREERLQRVKTQLEAQLISKEKKEKKTNNPIPLTPKDRDRIKAEIKVVTSSLSSKGKKKRRQKKVTEGEAKGDRYFIDIYTVKYGYVRNSERRKNKGKSRKKLKKVKSTSFVRSVVAQPGMITAYKEGRMGMSPKTHIFKMRKEEISLI